MRATDWMSDQERLTKYLKKKECGQETNSVSVYVWLAGFTDLYKVPLKVH